MSNQTDNDVWRRIGLNECHERYEQQIIRFCRCTDSFIVFVDVCALCMTSFIQGSMHDMGELPVKPVSWINQINFMDTDFVYVIIPNYM